MTFGPLDPFGGVSLRAVRESLASELAEGRGPGSPARVAQAEAERRELRRLVDHYRAHPGHRPRDWAEPAAEDLRPPPPPPAGPGGKDGGKSKHRGGMPLFSRETSVTKGASA